MLTDYHSSVLPSIVEGWNDMTELEREQVCRMNNFFCGLHFLVGLAETAEATVKQWEATTTCNPLNKTSGTQRLVCTACKAFHYRGSEQCGSSTLFCTYCRKQGLKLYSISSLCWKQI